MKIRLTSPTFVAAARTVTHASFSDVTLAGIQLIVNVTDQVIIYNFADSTKGGTLSTDTLTLEYDTTSMSDTDELMVLVDDGATTTAVSGTVAVTNAGITTIAGAVAGTEMQVDVLSSALPTGASTSAKQDTIIGHVDGIEGSVDGIETLLGTMDADTGNIATSTASIDTKTPALGQALATGSVPVVLTAAQVTTLTPPAAITGFATSAKQPALGTAGTASTDVITVQGITSMTPLKVDGSGVTQPVSGTVTANLSATDNAVLDDIASDTEAIKTSLAGTLTVTGGGGGVEYTEGDTDATITGSVAMMEVGADTVQPIQGTVAGGLLVNLGANNDVTVTGTVDLGATDNAVLDTIAAKDFATQTTLAAINTKLVTGTDIGDVTINNSTGAAAVNIQDGGNTITVDGTVAVTNAGITTIAGAVAGTEMQVDIVSSALPTGASTLAEQQSQTTHLATIAGDTTSVQTAVELIDDAVYTDGSGTVTKGIAILGQDGTNPQAIKTDASGELQVDVLSMPTTAVTGTFWQATQPVSLTSTTVTGTVAVTQSGTWDEVGINDSGNSITVDYATTGSGTATGALRVELPTNGTGVIATVGAVTAITNALPAGTNAIGKLSANSGVDIGDVDVTSISAGTNLVGDVGIQPRTTNGLDTFMASGSDGSSILVATVQAVKASAGKVYGYYLYNPETAVTFVHFYNTASGSVTVGTTNPLFTLAIPGGSGANLMNDIGITFGTAISMSATTTAGGNTAPATGVSAVVWFK